MKAVTHSPNTMMYIVIISIVIYTVMRMSGWWNTHSSVSDQVNLNVWTEQCSSIKLDFKDKQSTVDRILQCDRAVRTIAERQYPGCSNGVKPGDFYIAVLGWQQQTGAVIGQALPDAIKYICTNNEMDV